MQIAVSEFKARCTEILRTLAEPIEVTNRGKVVAVVSPPKPTGKYNAVVGCLEGTVTYATDWDEPLGEDDWEAAQ
jgi:antitoxin (DNA-binding transcriptional repressor) of toxin-antitoxin stability system